jgi:hypothetical protein
MRSWLFLATFAACASSTTPAPVTPTGNSGVQPATATKRRVVFGDKTVWCIRDGKYPEYGDCSFTSADCARTRGMAISKGYDPTECVEQTRAACFDATRVIAERREPACAPSIAQCEITLAEFRKNPDEDVHDEQCYVYRVRLPGAVDED